MRNDMSKIIVERPRLTSDAKYYKPGRKKDFEDLPLRESIKRKYGWHSKRLNENLAPLYNFLHTKVGKPWNSIFKEICENISINSTVQKHIRDHIKTSVEKEVVMKGKIPFYQVIGSWQGDELQIANNFYVHPTKGTLEYAPKKIYPKPKPDPNFKKLEEMLWLVKEKDVWYLAELDWVRRHNWRKLLQNPKYKFVHKPFTKYRTTMIPTSIKNEDGTIYFSPREEVLDIKVKRQLSKKQLKEYNLV